jgi:uncharacterized protein YunC (DUF1805 family)
MFEIPLRVSVWVIQNHIGIAIDRSIPEVSRQGEIPRRQGFLSLPCQLTLAIPMCDQKLDLAGKHARGFVYSLGPVNLVAVVTDMGMVGCGAFDVAALEKFDYPAARVRPATGPAIVTIDDLLSGIVKDANGPARARGVEVGMTGREAVGRL